MSRKRKARRPKHGQSKKYRGPVTEEDLQHVRRIADRMLLDLRRARRMCDLVGRSVLNENLDEFWALVKYVENVQDGIVQLDNKNGTVFPKLIEFPETSNDRGETTWKSLKGMRSRLAHAFDHIDHDILWDTVNQDFPRLQALLEVVHFARCENGRFAWQLQVGRWRRLPPVTSSQALDGTNSIPALVFDERGRAMCLRIGRIADDQIAIAATNHGFSIQKIALHDSMAPSSSPRCCGRHVREPTSRDPPSDHCRTAIDIDLVA